MKFFFLLVIFSLYIFTGCYSRSKHEMLMDKIVSNFTSDTRKSENLQTFAYGGSMYGGVVRFVTLEYEKNQFIDIAEAREIMVRSIEKFLFQVNNNVKIRPYLLDYPFTTNNIQFGVIFRYNPSEKSHEKYIARAICRRNKIFYQINDKDSNGFKNIFEEEYEEALRIVMKFD